MVRSKYMNANVEKRSHKEEKWVNGINMILITCHFRKVLNRRKEQITILFCGILYYNNMSWILNRQKWRKQSFDITSCFGATVNLWGVQIIFHCHLPLCNSCIHFLSKTNLKPQNRNTVNSFLHFSCPHRFPQIEYNKQELIVKIF